MTNTNQPLYKQLNEQRTQGEWNYEYDNDEFGQFFNTIAEDYKNVFKYRYGCLEDIEYKSNAQYTCLAVNNLHHLAEALENLINKASETTKDIVAFEGAYILDKAIDKAKEALNRIS